MGGTESRKDSGSTRQHGPEANVTSLELRLTQTFKRIVGQQNTVAVGVTRDQFLEFAQSYLELILCERLFKKLLELSLSSHRKANCPPTSSALSQNGFVHAATSIIKGGLDDKARIFIYLSSDNDLQTSTRKMRECLNGLIKYFLSVPETEEAPAGERLVDYLLTDLKALDRNWVSPAEVERWMSEQAVVPALLSSVLFPVFGLTEEDSRSQLLPLLQSPSALLDRVSLLCLNQVVPVEYRRRWALLYSNLIQGESFSKLTECVCSRGPCLIVMKDSGGNVFGGFCSPSLKFSPTFRGDDHCFLFSLHPSLQIFQTTGYNRNFLYQNSGQQTLPNGLGLGGVSGGPTEGAFSLWLDGRRFGTGSCVPGVATFNAPLLSSSPDFQINLIEIWSVNSTSPDDLEPTKKVQKSALDRNPDAAAILEIMGKTRASEGLRQPEEDED